MRRRPAEMLLWGVAFLGVALTGVQLRARTRHRLVPHTPPAFTVGELLTYDGDVLATAADSLASRDPFLTSEHASDLTATTPPVPTSSPPQTSPVPQLALDGIMGGPPWRAVVTGFPGRDGGVIVATGDTVGAFRVRAVRRDAVVIATDDTTWTLTPR